MYEGKKPIFLHLQSFWAIYYAIRVVKRIPQDLLYPFHFTPIILLSIMSVCVKKVCLYKLYGYEWMNERISVRGRWWRRCKFMFLWRKLNLIQCYNDEKSKETSLCMYCAFCHILHICLLRFPQPSELKTWELYFDDLYSICIHIFMVME